MSYENWKIKKSEIEEKQEEYTEVAIWCNESGQYSIEEIEDEYCVVKNPEPLPPTKEEIRQQRIAYRKANIDNQTNERTRRMANGTWTEQDEQDYLELDAQVTAWIEENLPYPTETTTSEVVNDSVLTTE